MDETIKVLIGTISGFIVAFMAEPVKSHFQNRNQRKHLRISLYKELFINYIWLSGNESIEDLQVFLRASKQALRFECYDHVITQQVTLFYQLREAVMITLLYANLRAIMTDSAYHNPEGFIKAFLQTLENEVVSGGFDKRLLVRVGGRETLEKMRKSSERRNSQRTN